LDQNDLETSAPKIVASVKTATDANKKSMTASANSFYPAKTKQPKTQKLFRLLSGI